MDKSRDRYTGWALAVVLALGVGVRWYYVADRSIWFDEAFSWRMIQYPFGEMFRRMALDNAPPLYYLLLKSWCACFGDSLPALRSLSVVMGGVTILAMFLFVRAATASLARADIERRANDRRGSEAALFAAMFVALSVFQIRWSWDARPYALGAALALLSSWALFRALWAGEQPPGATCSTRAPGATGALPAGVLPARHHWRLARPWFLRTGSKLPVAPWRWWYVYAALAVLFAYTHYFALFALAAQGGFVLYVLMQRAGWNVREMLQAPAARGAALAFGLIGLCWLPWLPFFLRQMSQVRADFWIRPVQEWDLAHTLYRMFVEPENAALTETASLWALDLCVLGWLILLWPAATGATCGLPSPGTTGGLPASVSSARAASCPWHPGAVFVAVSALTPIGASILLDSFGVHLFLLRYLLFAHLFFLAGLAMLVNRIPFSIERRFVAGVLTAWGLFAWFSFCEKAGFPNHPGARAAAECIVRQAKPEEPVLVSSPFCYLPMLYHLRHRGNCYLYQEKDATPHYLGRAVLRPEDVMSARGLQGSQFSRLWVVDTTNAAGGVREVPDMNPREVRQQEQFPEVFGLGEIIVCHYIAPSRVASNVAAALRVPYNARGIPSVPATKTRVLDSSH
ncbi:MAG: hypothetical protein ACLQNE_38095 [Thermoguttaceae bacterium]